MTYQSTKTYGHELGFSCAFRQWRAQSHCRFLHGYTFSFKFIFEAEELDSTNFVVDFGGLKSLKATLQETFDHKTVVASDDPGIGWFQYAHSQGYLSLVELKDGVGCEKFAKYAYDLADKWLTDSGYTPRCKVLSCEVSEHGANSAIYLAP